MYIYLVIAVHILIEKFINLFPYFYFFAFSFSKSSKNKAPLVYKFCCVWFSVSQLKITKVINEMLICSKEH